MTVFKFTEEDRGHDTPCWIWQGALSNGYGRLGHADKVSWSKTRQAHRLYYEHFVGPIPAGYEVDHLCFVRACVNPDHLEAVTPAENRRRAIVRSQLTSRLPGA